MSNYLIRFTEPHDVELWSTVRLTFEPKGWVKQMRDELRFTLGRLKPEPSSALECLYVSNVEGYFDTENVLLYNVGSSYFKHLCQNGLLFERRWQEPPDAPSPTQDGFRHYHRYKLVPKSYWSQSTDEAVTMAAWNDLTCPPLSSETRPHALWSLMKQHPIMMSVTSFHGNFGMDVLLKVPMSRPVNVAALIKPLLDGIISAFHSHDGSDLTMVASRLAQMTGISESNIATLLMQTDQAILGQRRLVHPRAQGVQWNPADDLCSKVRLSIQYEHIQDWTLSGRLMQA